MSRTQRSLVLRIAAYAAVLLLFALLLSRVSLPYDWQWGRFFGDGWWKQLARGLLYTLLIAVEAMALALPLGVLIGLCRTAHDPGARLVGFLFVELFRGTPLLVQLMLWYFLLSTALPIGAHGSAVFGLACFAGSYIAEIVRAGIQGIDRGQMEAARSLGLTHAQALRHIILPQALRRILPPLASEFIALVKDSSLASVITITELTKATQDVQSGAYMTFEPWLTAASVYLVLSLLLSTGVRLLERSLGQGHKREGIR